MLYANVIVPLSVPDTFTYLVPQEFESDCQVGKRVIIQFGKKKFYTAIIKSIHSNKPDYKTKEIYSIIDRKPLINELHLKFWQWIADYYMANIGDVYTAAMPVSLRIESQTQIFLSKEIIDEQLSKNEEFIIENLKSQKTLTLGQVSKIADVKNPVALINRLISKGLVDVYEHFNPRYKPKYIKLVKLSAQIQTQQNLTKTFEQLSRAKKQTEILLSYSVLSNLQYVGGQFIYKDVQKKDLLEKANVSSGVLNSLFEKQILTEYEKQVSRLGDFSKTAVSFNKLNIEQSEAFEKISEIFENKNVILLHGVTSSGKTEVYIELIRKYIKHNKQVLYLLPEIALTTQIIERLRVAFGHIVGVYHSKFNDSERAEIWSKIGENSDDLQPYKIILGVRSAIFLPYDNLGLIIVDEEHETTYKQFDPAPRYNARDAAIVLAKMHNAKVLLGTATPSVESFDNAISGKFGLVKLNKRYKNLELPNIILADVRQARNQNKMKSIFHPLLIENIKEALGNAEQVILFQNRRGFSPYVECNTCGWIPKCVNCDVSLTYHLDSNDLVCHYCGFKRPIPKKCENCNDLSIQTKGFGTQKIEDEIKIFFPEIKVGRLDLDVARRKHGYEQVLQDFDAGETDILVGTQMVTKGLDFENVRVVGVLNADNLLNFPDFRSFERSFQLLTQVSGRAGRMNERGKVIIQTSNINHKILSYVMQNNFRQYFDEEIHDREVYNYPPFVRIIKISVKHKNSTAVYEFAENYAIILKKVLNNRVLGPQEPLVNRIQNYHIREIIVKLENSVSHSKTKLFMQRAANNLKMKKNFSSIIVVFNVDPL
ncbi:MAG: primosomal protein N' [Bacteroidales bacterium]|nr:primosomal protein N' [Bacteroidales bacterium]